MKAKMQIKNLKSGERFSFSGYDWILLGDEQGGKLAVTEKIVGKYPFDEDGCNDWRKSSLRKLLNSKFLEMLKKEDLLPFTSDLTADDGLTDYGSSEDLVFILSDALYRKYRYKMPKYDTWTWTITPYSTLPSGGRLERLVYTSGAVDYDYANDAYGAAVACLLNPESEIDADRRSEGAEEKKSGAVKVKLEGGAFPPVRAHKQDAGLDLICPESEAQVIPAKESAVFDTGVCVQIPEGFVGFLKSKSGLNVKHGITGEGVIDAGYTGSIRVKLYNNSGADYEVKKGDKISQLVILPIITPDIEIVDEIEETDRGENGFGSSGR